MSVDGKTFKPTENSATILEFPKNRIIRKVETQEKKELLEDAKKRAKQSFANDITDNIMTKIVNEFKLAGVSVDTESDNFHRDLSFAVEAVRSLVYRVFELKYHLHDFVDNNVKLKSMEDIDIESENDKLIALFEEEANTEPEPA